MGEHDDVSNGIPGSELASARDAAMGIRVHSEGEITDVVVSGNVDLLAADHLRSALLAEVTAAPAVLLADLDAVEFLSSSGSSALALAHRAAVEAGVDLRIVATSRITLRPLQVTGMTEDLLVFASRADALASPSAAQPSLRIG